MPSPGSPQYVVPLSVLDPLSQLKSLREREALEAASASVGSSPLGGMGGGLRLQPDELFLYPAECSTVTALPGVARVVHSKASCTVHWQESGKVRPGAKEQLQTPQILGIHALTPPPRGGGPKAGRAATTTTAADPRRAEPPLALPDPLAVEPGAVGEEKKSSPPPGTPPTATPTSQPSSGPKVEDGDGAGPQQHDAKVEETSGGLLGTSSTTTTSSGQDKQPCGGTEGHPEDAHATSTGGAAPATSTGGAAPASSSSSPPDDAQQIRAGGWSGRGADNVTLAELYLMLGKPSKLQLEYEWQPAVAPPPPPPPTAAASSSPGSSPGPACPPPPRPQPRPSSANQVLRCLLRLVTTEVNPKPLVRTGLCWETETTAI